MAIQVSIKIMNAFVEMRRFLISNAGIFERLDRVELKQLEILKSCCLSVIVDNSPVRRYNQAVCCIFKFVGYAE